MRLGVRLLLSYFLIVGLMTYFLSSYVYTEVKPLLRQSVEETLVDSANMLAEIIAVASVGPTVSLDAGLRDALTGFTRRRPEAGIWTLRKTFIDMHVYVTDANGVVIFDSRGRDEGKDYSQWIDVYRTLKGNYGARTTQDDPNDAGSSVMYIAAPILVDERIVGVVSVGKPARTIEPFANRAKRHLTLYGTVLLASCLAIGLAITHWLARRLGLVQRFALAVSRGERVPAPLLKGEDEVAKLSSAVAEMRDRLEGYSYVEQTVQMLVHEMKSPLTAIRGGSELLSDELQDRKLRQLAVNIGEQGERLGLLLNRLLHLARLEKLEQLPAPQPVELASLVKAWQDTRREQLQNKNLTLEITATALTVDGNAELLALCLNNLLDNALDFADRDTLLRVTGHEEDNKVVLAITDTGARIPDYALERLFERFYSLPRPGTDRRGSGLGLSIVRQVMLLHSGGVNIDNDANGVIATIWLPARHRDA